MATSAAFLFSSITRALTLFARVVVAVMTSVVRRVSNMLTIGGRGGFERRKKKQLLLSVMSNANGRRAKR
jgi:hypothetical protein